MSTLGALADVFSSSPPIERTIGKAIGEKDSKRIIHFNEIRECFLSSEIPPERQAQIMRKELSSTLKAPKKTLHLVNLILMLFNHCQPGFSCALTEPESIEELLACFVLCKARSNAAKKLAWLIKLLISFSERLSERSTYPEEVNAVGLDTFCQDSWVPEMTLDDYYELEKSIVSKHTDLGTISNIMKSVDKSDDIKVLEKQRSVVKELQHRLMLDEHFLQEVRNSFCVSEWPKTGITEPLKHIEDALFAIDSLLAALRSTSGLVATSATIPYGGSSFNGEALQASNHEYPSAYEAQKRFVVDKYARAHDIQSIISIINTTDNVEVLRQQYTAAKDLQTRLVKDMEDLRDLQKQCCPTASPEEPLKTFEESSQQGEPLSPPSKREPPSPPLRSSVRHQQLVSISGLDKQRWELNYHWTG
ncbi:hypothetical protein TSMEX_008172 [Taenia solium]|eukprot:TsM_000477800 transcript=TsM_000477800 gene=TsM_000477800